MKLFSAALVSMILAGAMATGCTESPKRMTASDLQPAIHLDGPRTIDASTSTALNARTENLVGAKGVGWTASPNGAKITADKDSYGQRVIFTADQPGTYVVTASVDMGNGHIVMDKTTVTVKDRPMVTERVPEPQR